jgi:hypothetical protein
MPNWCPCCVCEARDGIIECYYLRLMAYGLTKALEHKWRGRLVTR